MEEETPLKYFHIKLEDAEPNLVLNVLEPAISEERINSNTNIVLSSVRECYNWKKIVSERIPVITSILQTRGINHWHYIVNSTFPSELSLPDNVDLVKIEHFAIDTYYRKKYEKVKFNQSWNSNSQLALFLMGKAGKGNRVPLLYRFTKANLINQIEYSFFPYQSNSLDVETEKEFKIATSERYDHFAQRYAWSPDHACDPLFRGVDHITDGYPFNTDLYRTTAISIIPESQINNKSPTFLTEKTWKAIANCHPFIIAGQPATLVHLKKLGFKTFENYLLHQDYDTIEDLDDKLDKIVENTEYFLNNYANYVHDINRDIKHNEEQLKLLIEDTLKKHEILQDENLFYQFFNNTKVNGILNDRKNKL